MRLPFVTREEAFYDLFDEAASNLVTGAGLLSELMEHWNEVEERVKRIKALEEEQDDVIHKIIAKLHRTFVTPLDREDIALLSHSMDDIMDFMEAAASNMFIYGIKKPTLCAKDLASLLVKATNEIQKAICLLRQRSKLREIMGISVSINEIENQADVLERTAVISLFKATDPIEIIKWREIYGLLEGATDRCEDVANVLEGVVLKHA